MHNRFNKTICLLLLCFTMIIGDEDADILRALEAMDNGQAKVALDVYKDLYKTTKKKEYLKEITSILIQIKSFNEAIKYAKDYEKNYKKDVSIKKMLIMSYLNLNNLNDAIKECNDLIKLEDTAENNHYLSTLYLLKKDLNNAILYAKKAHELNADTNSLMLITLINIENNNFNEAIPLIKQHFKNEISEDFALILNSYAVKYKLISKIKDLYLEFYEKKHTNQNAFNLARIYAIDNNIDKALELSKTNKFDTNFIIDLYLAKKDYANAKKETQNAYNKTKDKSYLGLLAIIEFESSSDKKSIVSDVIAKLKDSVSSKPNHIFYNYLGYLLIDYNIDIKDGIKYVNNALQYDPNNPAYIDSLAWGYYKNNECKKAKIEIDKIPPVVIENEIRDHIKAIDECLAK